MRDYDWSEAWDIHRILKSLGIKDGVVDVGCGRLGLRIVGRLAVSTLLLWVVGVRWLLRLSTLPSHEP